jgi:hypothetical protein
MRESSMIMRSFAAKCNEEIFAETFQIRRRHFHAMASSDFHAEHGAASYGNFKYPHEL